MEDELNRILFYLTSNLSWAKRILHTVYSYQTSLLTIKYKKEKKKQAKYKNN